MKNRVTHLALLFAITVTASCAKSDTATTPTPSSPEPDNYPALNSVEQQLIGRWMIREERDTSFYYDGSGTLIDTYIATPRNNSDTIFNYRFMSEENDLGIAGYDYARRGYDARRSVPGDENFGWLYDASTAKLKISSTETYTILSLTPTELYIVMTQTSAYNGSGTQRSSYYERFTRL